MPTLREFYEQDETVVWAAPDRAGRQVRILMGILASATSPQRVLDLGCGDGGITELIARKASGHHVVGMDWAMNGTGQARRRGVHAVCAAIDGVNLPFASGSLDVVMFNEVIEHLVDTDAAICEIRRVLRPGGRLLLSTPNLAAWFNRGMLLFGGQPVFSEVSLRGVFGRPGSQVVGHLRLFTKRALTGFLGAYGFRDIVVRGAAYHDVPKGLAPIDRLLTRWPSGAAILLVEARTPE
jgi:SAM-dependent methyltransferase